ncbi:hypothetical protein VTK56DRAFT_26 [Thermocarpiscus australiensis]
MRSRDLRFQHGLAVTNWEHVGLGGSLSHQLAQWVFARFSSNNNDPATRILVRPGKRLLFRTRSRPTSRFQDRPALPSAEGTVHRRGCVQDVSMRGTDMVSSCLSLDVAKSSPRRAPSQGVRSTLLCTLPLPGKMGDPVRSVLMESCECHRATRVRLLKSTLAPLHQGRVNGPMAPLLAIDEYFCLAAPRCG